MVLNEITYNRNVAVLNFDTEVIRLPKYYMRDFPFRIKEEIDPDVFNQWVLEKQYKPALDYAVSLLSSRPYAERELKQKLQQHGYRENTVELILYKLNRHELLNDSEFADQWARSRMTRNIGHRRIAMELKQKGVDSETIEQALENIDENDEMNNAMDLVRRQLSRQKPGEDPRKTAQRISAMLVRRGYSFDTARAAISEVMEEIEDDMES